MKNRLFNAFLLLAMVGVMFTACKKEYPQPPIQDLPIGTVYTIGDILAMESGTVFNEDASVYGIITADEVSGNLYKAAYMQDRATGDAIQLYLDAPSGVRIGDSVRIYLKDVTYALYNNLPQLSNFIADGHIIILANGKPIQPALTTIANINAGQHLAGLVRLENVKFTEQNTFADPTGYGNRTLADPTDYSQTVIVRTSNYANFANDSLPQGTGNLVAIASVYNNTWQLTIRSIKELEFDGYNPGGDADLPYYQDFTSSFGTYTTYDVAGAQSWEIDYSTAKMTGFVNSTNYANEDWLISKKVSLQGVSEVSMTMTYIARYFDDVNKDITVQVSTDYSSGDPTQANWTEVPASWVEGNNWNDFVSTTIDLSQFAGQKVTVAVKYLSNDQKAGTIEVQSILIQEGSGPTPPTPPTPGGEVQSMPYFQSFASEFGTYMTYDLLGSESWMIDFSTAKMTGYVDGSYYANEDWLISSPVAITNVSDAKMTMVYIGRYFSNINDEVTIWASTNYNWGDNPQTATWNQVPATLTEGTNWSNFLTAEISLTEYVGQTVTFAVKYTSTDSKAGTMEIQSICIEEGSGEVPPTPPTPGQGEGSGTFEDPYNVAAGIANNQQYEDNAMVAWVQGYIVGAVKSGTTSVSSNNDINWNAPFDSNTNVVIADDPNCNEIDLCVIVNLPAGKPLRTEVNLIDHSENLGKMLAVTGKLYNYFGKAGLRKSNGTVNDFVLEGSVTPPDPGTGELQYLPYVQSFATSFGTYMTYDVSGAQSWMIDYSTAKMTGYENSTNYANEDWLISSPVALTGVNDVTMTMVYIGRYFEDINESVTIWVSNDYTYGNAPETANWTRVPSTLTESSNWNDFKTVELSLNSFVGQTVTVAVKYLSSDVKAGTIEIKSIAIQ